MTDELKEGLNVGEKNKKQVCLDLKSGSFFYKSKRLKTDIRSKYKFSDLIAKILIFKDILFHVKPSADGSSRLSFFLRKIKDPNNQIFEVNINNYPIKFVFNKNGGLGIISVRRFEPIVFKYITSQHGEIMIDIGANVGAYSILSSHNFQKIIAVEPGKESLDILQQNISLNNINNITVISKAVTNKKGFVKLYKASALVNYSTENKSESYLEVPTITLNELLQPFSIIDLVKIDVEGAELEVIRSGLELIDRVKNLIIEVRQKYEDEIISLMSEKGFQCYCLEFRKDVKEKNLLFVNVKNNQ